MSILMYFQLVMSQSTAIKACFY